MEVVSLFGSYGNVHLLMLLFIIAQLCASIMSPFLYSCGLLHLEKKKRPWHMFSQICITV